MKLKRYNLAKMAKLKVVLSDYETRLLIGGASLIDDDIVALNFNEMLQVYGSVGHFPSYIQENLGINTASPSASELNMLSIMTFEISLSELDPFFVAYWGLSSVSDDEGSSDDFIGGNDNLFRFAYDITEDLANRYGYGMSSNTAINFLGTLYSTLRNLGYTTSENLSYIISQDEGMNFSYRLVISENENEVYNEIVSL